VESLLREGNGEMSVQEEAEEDELGKFDDVGQLKERWHVLEHLRV
jgi:hypothetical protein